MNFAQPGLAAAALVAGALPILLHLLLRRPRATSWPSTMLLRRALERLRRRRRLDAWILLALRAIGVAAVGLAMAGPFLGGAMRDQGSRELWIVLDDGATSAERLDDETTTLEAMRRSILKELETLRDGDRVALIRASMPARIEVPLTADRSRVRVALESITTQPVPAGLVAALELALPAEPESSPREVLLASGYRKGSLRPDQQIPGSWSDRARKVRWSSLRPPKTSAGNRWIEQVDSMSTSGMPTETAAQRIRVSLARSSTSDARDEVQVRALDGEVLGQVAVAWKSGSTRARAEIPIQGMRSNAFLAQASPDAQPLDDTIAAVDARASTPRVTVLGRRSDQDGLDRLSASSWIIRALEAAGVAVREMDPSTLALRPPSDSDVVILCRPDLVDAAGWKWIGRFVRDGGLIVTMPVPGVEPGWITDAVRETGVDLRMSPDPITQPITLRARQPRTAMLASLGAEIDDLASPVTIQRHWSISGGSSESVLVMSSDDPAVLAVRPRDGRGLWVLFAFPLELDSTDLPLRPLMVPLLQEIVRAGRSLALGSESLRSGMRGYLGPSAAGGLLRAGDDARSTAIEIGADGFTVLPIPAPGLWRVEQRDGKSRWVAVTLDPASASIEPVLAAEIEAWRAVIGKWAWIDERDAVADDIGPGESPWTMPLLVLALLLLVGESVWSRNSSPRPNPEATS